MDNLENLIIPGWVLNNLNLNLTEAVIFSVIYGFSQDGHSKYTGTQTDLMQWAKCSRRTAQNVLNKLVDDGLIDKDEVTIQSIRHVSYAVNCTGCAKFAHGVQQKEREKEESRERNRKETENERREERTKEENKDRYKEKNNKESKELQKEKDRILCVQKFRKPTFEEVSEYCRERKNGIDAQAFIDFYDANGWHVGRNPMKDWKAAVRTWEHNKKAKGTGSAYLDAIKNRIDIVDTWV